MTEAEFKQLLTRPEGESIDYKLDYFDLKKDRSSIIKDILAMANTPRTGTAYIVLGVRWTPENGSETIGINTQHDDADFQTAVGDGTILPTPKFSYTPLTVSGKQFGILEIPVDGAGPYTAAKDIGKVNAGVVYYRQGTKNACALGPELTRISSWFQGAGIGNPVGVDSAAWQSAYEDIQRFDPSVTYLLAVDRVASLAPSDSNSIALVPWRAVIDFDPESEASGLLHSIGSALGRHRVVHRVVHGDHRVQPEPGTHWFFARGLSGRSATISAGDHKSWLKAYKQELGHQLRCLAAAINPNPLVAIVFWSDVELKGHLRTFIEEAYGYFGESISIVVVTENSPALASICEESGASIVEMTQSSFCAGVGVHFADQQCGAEERYVLPTSSGAPKEFSLSEWLWLSEDLELLHRSVGMTGDDSPDNFRRGAAVTLRNLQLRHDCDRDITPALRTQVEMDLRKRQTVRINLYHSPGGGGTTVGNRIAWDFHLLFPVAILKNCSARDTSERISKVVALTEHSVLLIVDGGQHSERDIDDLYEYLKANQTPVVILQVLRKVPLPRGNRRLYPLEAILSDSEADRFRVKYTQSVPDKSGPLAVITNQRDKQRNAFFYGLTAYGKNFIGLNSYVKERIAGLSEMQLTVIVYIAISHCYGQQPVPAQAFASVLGLPRTKVLDLSSVFASNATKIFDILINTHDNEWRTAHTLVGLEILEQVLSPRDTQDRSAVWRQQLSTWAKKFIDFCCGNDNTPSDRLLELVRRVFIFRDNTDFLGTEGAASRRGSQLIEDIPSVSGKLEVLRYLTEIFPLEAHFHAHLGRYLGFCGEYLEGVACLKYAISIQPDDSVLHHMFGMVLRQQLKAELSNGRTVHEVIDIARLASNCFEEARRLSPDIEHGYISEVQMLIDLLDKAGRGTRSDVFQVLSQQNTDIYLKQALDRAEDLLDRVQNLYVGETPSRYALDCRARLQRVYGNFDTSLQVWDNLLTRPEVAKPSVRRQIVWTILRRRNGEWETLSLREINRVRLLLEENLEEELSDSTSLRLWLRAVRHAQTPPSIDSVIEKVAYWKANTGSLDASYYLYVLHTIRALDGSSQAAADAERALDECQSIARFRRDRTRSFEWIGHGVGVQSLIHQSRLGEWKDEFWDSTDSLIRLEGRISSIDGPHKGFIELAGGVKAFFVPGRLGFHSGRDENASVSCFLGFSYDGPRAWDAKRIEV